MADKRYERPEYEYPIRGLNWTAGVGQPAGMYWLDGRTLIAGHGSLAEDYLLAMGAIHIGTLRFDADPLERSHPGRVVDTIPASAFAARVPLTTSR